MIRTKCKTREMYHGKVEECEWCGGVEKLRKLSNGVLICEECQKGFVEEKEN